MRLIDPTKTHTTIEGRAKTGEVSTKGLVTHREGWDGTTAVVAAPNAIHYIYDDEGEFRPMTMPEMIAKGYFVIGVGPHGF